MGQSALRCLFLLLLLAPPGAGAFLGNFTDLESCRAALLTTAPTARALPFPLHVGSWNVMKLDRRGARQQVVEMSRDTDLLLLQEAPSDLTLFDQLHGDHFAPGFQRAGQLTGVSMHSRLPADISCTLSFREPWLRSPKAVLALRIPGAGQSLLAINLHGINFTLGSGAYRRQLEAIEVLVRTHTGPVIVAGDFNHWNPWRRWVLEEFRAGLGLREAQFSPDWRSRHLGSPVDSAFVRGLRVISATAAPTTRSDHNPLTVLVAPPAAPAQGSPVPGDAPSTAH